MVSQTSKRSDRLHNKRLEIGSRWVCQELAMEFVYVPAGSFLMGAQDTDPNAPNYDVEAEEDEAVRSVTLQQNFWLGRFPVTNAQYRHYIEKGGGGGESLGQTGFDDPEQPVTWVSWHEAQSFCKWASQYSPWPMGLPTETEWEYAARGQDGRIYAWGNDAPDIKDAQAPDRVGGRPASPFGAEDLSGNVWEWCADPYRPSEDDTLRPTDDIFRVLRGGAWCNVARALRAAYRLGYPPRIRNGCFGFRMVMRIPT